MNHPSKNFDRSEVKKAFSILLQKPLGEFDNSHEYHLYINIDDLSTLEETRQIKLSGLKKSPKNAIRKNKGENILNYWKIDFSKSYFPVYPQFHDHDFDNAIHWENEKFLLGKDIAGIAESQLTEINDIILDFGEGYLNIYKVVTDGSLYDAMSSATFLKSPEQVHQIGSLEMEEKLMVHSNWESELLQIKDEQLRRHFSRFCVSVESARAYGFCNKVIYDYESGLEPILNIGNRIIEWTTAETLSPSIGIFQVNNKQDQ